jgi:hypothetical protein
MPEIFPFPISIPERDLTGLSMRLDLTRLPEPQTVPGVTPPEDGRSEGQIRNEGAQRDPVRWFKMKACGATQGAISAAIPAHFLDSPTCFHGAPPPRAALACIVEQPSAFATSSTHPESGPLPMLEHFQNIQRYALQRKIWVESALCPSHIVSAADVES